MALPSKASAPPLSPPILLTAPSGITGGHGGDRRVEYIIPHDARAQGFHEFVIESSCNGMFGVPWSGDIIAPPDVCIPTCSQPDDFHE
jgi:hypothetical protein